MLKNNKAFSLIELSIVILIIGILVTGITQSSRLVKSMKIQSIQNLTQSSPVATIKDLSVWYETVLQKSFIEDEKVDQSTITTWFDANPLTMSKADASAPNTNSKPRYIENAFNGLPGVRFDGADDYLRSDNISVTGNQMTYFIVAKRRVFVQYATPFSTLSPGATYDSIGVGHLRAYLEDPSVMTVFRNGWLASIPHPGNNIPYISSSVIDGSNHIAYLNGVSGSSVATSGAFNITTILLGCTWQNGAFNNPYNGEIAEIIIYSRALKTDERKDIEKYLSKKWAIKIS